MFQVQVWRRTRNEDLSEITLKLRLGVTFQEGTPFNAEAVKRNFERNMSLGCRAGNTVFRGANLIAAIELQGDDTVKLKLKLPNGQVNIASVTVDRWGSVVTPR